MLNSETETLRMVNPVKNSFADTNSIVSETLLNLTSEITDEQITELTTFPENGEELIDFSSKWQHYFLLKASLTSYSVTVKSQNYFVLPIRLLTD